MITSPGSLRVGAGDLTGGSGDPGWSAAHHELAWLSNNSVHRTIRGATHIALLDDAKFATDSSTAVDEVVVSVRTHTPLQP